MKRLTADFSIFWSQELAELGVLFLCFPPSSLHFQSPVAGRRESLRRSGAVTVLIEKKDSKEGGNEK